MKFAVQALASFFLLVSGSAKRENGRTCREKAGEIGCISGCCYDCDGDGKGRGICIDVDPWGVCSPYGCGNPPHTTSIRVVAEGVQIGSGLFADRQFNPAEPAGFGIIPFTAGAWIWDGQARELRTLLKFDLSDIPDAVSLLSASIDFYADTKHALYGQGIFNSEQIGHSQLSGGNDFNLLPITDKWTLNNVTWNTQPETTSDNGVFLPASSSHDQDYLGIDVTDLVRAELEAGETELNLMMQLEVPSHYRAVQFISPYDAANITEHPSLALMWYEPTSN